MMVAMEGSKRVQLCDRDQRLWVCRMKSLTCSVHNGGNTDKVGESSVNSLQLHAHFEGGPRRRRRLGHRCRGHTCMCNNLPDVIVGIVAILSGMYLSSLIPRPTITANEVEGLVKLLRRMTSGGRLEVWHFW